MRYVDIFKPVKRIYDVVGADFERDIDGLVKQVRKSLKKSNLITWYLKAARAGMIYDLLNRTSGEKRDLVRKVYDDMIGKLPDPKIRDLVESGKTWTLLSLLKKANPELLDTEDFKVVDVIDAAIRADGSRKAVRKYEEGDEPDILVDFPDGSRWVNHGLACDYEEGVIGGHCGNEGANPGEVLLSLEVPVKENGKRSKEITGYWRPVLTFVMTPSGKLVERKGMYNKKPGEEYHSHILTLLKLPIITGFDNSRSNENTDFYIEDLSPELQEELRRSRPDLFEYRYPDMISNEDFIECEYDGEEHDFLLKDGKYYLFYREKLYTLIPEFEHLHGYQSGIDSTAIIYNISFFELTRELWNRSEKFRDCIKKFMETYDDINFGSIDQVLRLVAEAFEDFIMGDFGGSSGREFIDFLIDNKPCERLFSQIHEMLVGEFESVLNMAFKNYTSEIIKNLVKDGFANGAKMVHHQGDEYSIFIDSDKIDGNCESLVRAKKEVEDELREIGEEAIGYLEGDNYYPKDLERLISIRISNEL